MIHVQTELCRHYTDRSSFPVALPHSFPLRIKLCNNFFCATEGRGGRGGGKGEGEEESGDMK